MTKENQLAEFNRLAAPVLEWLKAGAPHATETPRPDIGFNMETVRAPGFDYDGNYCGTVMCIAGAIAEFNGLDGPGYEDDIMRQLIRKFDNLNDLNDLFYPGWSSSNFDMRYTDIKPEDAAIVLEHFMKTGKSTWVEYFYPEEEKV